ncbi:hypothetical protein LTR36_001872 [Oleoguttula mirabilis]|uniref:Uncharacterized protein n=1 Tax=Oleoguttula mirabilis TaxID=1507867 RepID=A0AAV9JNW4_9PEZI|nr:hypothetical protein LTR36_001872 [Oleoguttula mirabilis]
MSATILMFAMGMRVDFCVDVTITPITIYPNGFITIMTTAAAPPERQQFAIETSLRPTGYGDCIGRDCGPQNYWPSQIPTIYTTITKNMGTTVEATDNATPVQWTTKRGFTNAV